MHPTNNTARVAGALYVVASAPAVFSYLYVPSTLIVSGNATATANNILASMRSGFLPRVLGIWLAINGFAYLIISFTGLLLPRYEETVSNIAFPTLFGEVVFTLWPVIKGANPKPVVAPASSAAGG